MFEKQIEIIKNYDIIDIIGRIAALALDYRNQNVSFMLNGLVDEITEHGCSYYPSSIRMSDKKFRNIINSVTAIKDLQIIVDPCENLFTQRVIFYGNHIVFNSVDNEPAYQLQLILNTFHLHEQEYSSIAEEFPIEYRKLIRMVLPLSDYIANQLGDAINQQKENGDRSSNIYIPDGQTVRKYTKIISFSGLKVRSALDDENLFWDILLEFGHAKSSDDRNRRIFSHPFLYDERTDRFIALDPGMIPQFLIYQFFILADRAGIKQRVLKDFNDIGFQDTLGSLSRLGHRIIDAKQRWDLDLICNDSYKEAILSVGTNEYILLSFLGDNVDDYGEDTIHKELVNAVGDIETSGHFSEIKHVLQDKQNVDKDGLFQLTSLNSIGRGLMIKFYQGNITTNYGILNLTPFELWCISVNESDHSNFIPRYIRAKSLIRETVILSMFSELDKIEAYDNGSYSFYLTDDQPIENVQVYFAPGESINYIKRALKKSDKKVVPGFKDGSLLEVELADPVRHIYGTRVSNDRVIAYIEIEKSGIWVISDSFENQNNEGRNVIYTSFDFFQYWLSECRKAFYGFLKPWQPVIITLKADVSGNDLLHYNEKNGALPVERVVTIEGKNNSFTVHWTAELKDYLVWKDNEHERKVIQFLLEFILKKIGKPAFNIDSIIEKAFDNSLKKKIYAADISINPCSKPLVSRQLYTAGEEDDEFIHDITGPELVKKGLWKYGKLNGDARCDALQVIVSYLYKEFVNKISDLSPEGLLENAYINAEALVYHSLTNKENYAHDVACFPERKTTLLERYNVYNKTLTAEKFFIEYIAACPPKGKKQFDSFEFEYLLSLCSSIITYAYQKDFYKYGLSNKEIEILPSGRLATDHKATKRLYEIEVDNREDALQFYSSNENIPSYTPSWSFSSETADAFFDEFGFTDQDFINVVLSLSNLWENDGHDVHVYPRDYVENAIFDHLKESGPTDAIGSYKCKNIEIVRKIIDSISLSERKDFLCPPDGFDNSEVWPWRFNRRLSFTARPIIVRRNDNGTDELIWGSRCVYRMLQYVFYSIEDSTFPARSEKLNHLMGRFSRERGRKFNDIVISSINEMRFFKVYPNVKKINGRRIADEKGMDLGDIDILLIDQKNHALLVIEVKSFKEARNPYEIHSEHMSLFEDKGKKKCYVTKHRRRVKWISSHLSDVIDQYGLDKSYTWNVKGLFIVDQPQVSNNFYNENLPFLSRPQLNKENLLKIESMDSN